MTHLSIDIFNPVYNFSPIYEDEPFNDGFAKAHTVGVYLQDQIALLDNLKLLIGGRFDSYNYESKFNEPSLNSISEASQFSPRVGIVYQPIEPISLYASFSQSFSPQFGRNRSGSPFKPEQGTQYEVGIKGDFLDNRLSTTLAAYQITKTNVLTEDPNDPEFSIQVDLFDERYFESTVNRAYINPGAPFTVLGTLSVQF
ncbi:TonB-dependent siderophore receptor [Chlorogloeopsis sp. ULAP02]|uniref:TonB-dependent siderophore receptor n=1 Tax=Chlorogloeopsis sp. ULAP02 TaxID=3107926 RepID=UPI003136A061